MQVAALIAASITLAHTSPSTLDSEPPKAICHFFTGRFCGEALRVSFCESRWNIWARNGQYENIFQMGYAERRRYGWHVAGSSAWLAARAAWRYFAASGYSWRAWTCRFAA